MTDNIIL